jgi:type I restriction enzyme S subunit
MTGSVNKFLNWSALEKFEFALPPIAEQQRIVGLIGAIDKAIDSYLAVPIEKLQEAMLSEFFNDPKVKFSNLTLSECADLDMGQSPPGESYNITGDGMPFLQGSAEFGIKNPKPVKWTTSPTKVAEPGDLLISVRAPVGDVNFADRKVCIGRGLARIRETDLATTSFLVLALQYAHKDLTAASGTGMFSSISGANLKKIRVKVPSKDKQQQLVHAVALLENVADSVESAVGKSRLLRRACLNEFATSETINV